MRRRGGIVVLGTPRSGTTLLRRLLDGHPQIVSPGETNILSGCARLLRECEIAEGVRVGVVAGLGHAGFSREEVLERLRRFAFSFHEDLAERAGVRRWAEKTAFDSFYLDSIVEFCGDEVQFVCLVRHGLDVVCSLEELSRKSHGFLPELHDYVRRYTDFYQAFAHCWVDLTNGILDLVDRAEGRALLLRYEDLVRKPEGELVKLFGFLDEAVPEGLVEKALSSGEHLGLGDWKTYGKRSLDEGSIARHARLSARTRRSLARIVNPTLVRCGYDALPTEGGEDTEDEVIRQRRYQLGLLAQRLNPSVEGESGTTGDREGTGERGEG